MSIRERALSSWQDRALLPCGCLFGDIGLGVRVPVLRSAFILLAAVLVSTPVARAADNGNTDSDADGRSQSSTSSTLPTAPQAEAGSKPSQLSTSSPGIPLSEREELRREVREEVRRALEKTKSDLREETDAGADAQNDDSIRTSPKQAGSLFQPSRGCGPAWRPSNR